MPLSTLRLSRTIQSVATGTQWSSPMKSRIAYDELMPGNTTECHQGSGLQSDTQIL